jgi:energy-converting hydrogenase A subunit H
VVSVNEALGGPVLYALEFGDIVDYFTPYTASLFLLALVFTVLAILSRPERQVDIAFGADAFYTKLITPDEMRFRRFMAVACGVASMGAMVSGDLFNYTLFTSMVGICNVGIVAAVKSRHVLNAAYQYGIIAMVATLPLFGGAAITLASTGTLSIWALSTGVYQVPLIAKAFLVIGVVGEGMAPFYAAKAEMFRAPGAPYVIMCSLSSLLIFLRVVEIVMAVGI